MKFFYSVGKIYYMIFAVIVVPVNVLVILLLSRGNCGLSSCTTCYLVAMAIADLLFIITGVILLRINSYHFSIFFLNITPMCKFIIIVLCITIGCSVWFTVTLSFDQFVIICSQNLKAKYCTKKTAVMVLAATSILMCLKNVPFFFNIESGEIFDNVPWFCKFKQSYYTDAGWVMFNWFDKILIPLLPYALTLLLNILAFGYILVTSQVRKGLRGHTQGANLNDAEMEGRRKSIILLFTISGSFILLWFLYVLDLLYYSIAGANPKYYNISFSKLRPIQFMLVDLNCSTNAFIYGVTQSKFRSKFKKVVKYPFTAIIQFINK